MFIAYIFSKMLLKVWSITQIYDELSHVYESAYLVTSVTMYLGVTRRTILLETV